jgi:phage terminase large subunit
MDADLTINDIYIPHLDNFARTQIFYGGSSSGKSWFLAQRCVLDVLSGGRNYLVCRQVARTIRSSVFQQVERVIREAGLLDYFSINKSDALITCQNGYQVIFAGLDDTEKIKSIVPAVGVITDIWIEEATETDRNSVKDLYKRQRGGDESTRKRMILSFNPILQSHWIYEEHFKAVQWADDQTVHNDGELSILKTTYRDNQFLTTQDHYDLENEKDKYRYQVYTLGNWGILGFVIFTDWVVADLDDPNSEYYLPEAQRTNRRNGLDFGYSVDPAALWCDHFDRKRKWIYIYDEIYERKLTNKQLAEQVKGKIGEDYVTCDSAEPKSIDELKGYGVSAMPALKGKDSILFGIQWLQGCRIIIDKRCINAKMEISTYHWQEDANGNAIQKPVEKDDHLIDAGRYAHERDMLETWVIS